MKRIFCLGPIAVLLLSGCNPAAILKKDRHSQLSDKVRQSYVTDPDGRHIDAKVADINSPESVKYREAVAADYVRLNPRREHLRLREARNLMTEVQMAFEDYGVPHPVGAASAVVKQIDDRIAELHAEKGSLSAS